MKRFNLKGKQKRLLAVDTKIKVEIIQVDQGLQLLELFLTSPGSSPVVHLLYLSYCFVHIYPEFAEHN